MINKFRTPHLEGGASACPPTHANAQKGGGTLSANDSWTNRYFEKESLHWRDRLRFVGVPGAIAKKPAKKVAKKAATKRVAAKPALLAGSNLSDREGRR